MNIFTILWSRTELTRFFNIPNNNLLQINIIAYGNYIRNKKYVNLIFTDFNNWENS